MGNEPCIFDDAVCQGGFPVVDMRDNAEIPDKLPVLIHVSSEYA
jgi:hypothetical protein